MTDVVSVVIPTKNRRVLLRHAIASVLAQQGVDVQLVVVDDGSDDGTSQDLHALTDGRVEVVFHDESRGVSAARNAGLARTDGRWLAYLDDDDLWSPDKLARQLAELRSTGASWCYAGTVLVDAELRVLHSPMPDPPKPLAKGLPFRNRIPAGPSNVLMDRALVAELGGFDTSLRYHEDWDLWIRVASAVGSPACVSAPLVAYTLHGENAMLNPADRSRIDRLFSDLEVVERRYEHLRGGEPADRAMVWRWLGSQYLRSGRRSEGIRAFARATRLAPVSTMQWARPLVGRPSGSLRRYRLEAEAWLAREADARRRQVSS